MLLKLIKVLNTGLQVQVNAAVAHPKISWHACRPHQTKTANWTKRQVEEERLETAGRHRVDTAQKTHIMLLQKGQIPSCHCCPLAAEGKSPTLEYTAL